MYALSGSASGHMMRLPPIHIPQASLLICSHPYSDPIRLVLHGDARPLAGRPASLRSAPGSRELQVKGLTASQVVRLIGLLLVC